MPACGMAGRHTPTLVTSSRSPRRLDDLPPGWAAELRRATGGRGQDYYALVVRRHGYKVSLYVLNVLDLSLS